MDEKMKEMMNGVIEKLNDEQKEKVKQCKTVDEFMALAGEWGMEIPDDMVDAVAGGESLAEFARRTRGGWDIEPEEDAHGIRWGDTHY